MCKIRYAVILMMLLLTQCAVHKVSDEPYVENDFENKRIERLYLLYNKVVGDIDSMKCDSSLTIIVDRERIERPYQMVYTYCKKGETDSSWVKVLFESSMSELSVLPDCSADLPIYFMKPLFEINDGYYTAVVKRLNNKFIYGLSSYTPDYYVLIENKKKGGYFGFNGRERFVNIPGGVVMNRVIEFDRGIDPLHYVLNCKNGN